MNLSDHTPSQQNNAQSKIVHFVPETLSLKPEQVARYAGGSRYKMDSKMKDLALITIDRAMDLIAPSMVYALHPVIALSPGGILLLKNGLSVILPLHEQDPQTKYLAAVICTIGPALEETCRELIKQGDPLHAVFLDGAGVSLIEAVGERAYDLISQQAGEMGLFVGCRFAPGYGGMEMTEQSLLFSLVDGATIGVFLNKSMVMTPNKSISFFVRLTSEETSSREILKCQGCQAKDCKFRVDEKL
jgi:hypothetical protein